MTGSVICEEITGELAYGALRHSRDPRARLAWRAGLVAELLHIGLGSMAARNQVLLLEVPEMLLDL